MERSYSVGHTHAVDLWELAKDFGLAALGLAGGAAGQWIRGRSARQAAAEKAERDHQERHEEQIREDTGRFAVAQMEAQPKILEETFNRINELEMQLTALHAEHVKLERSNARLRAENKYLRNWSTTIPNMPAHGHELEPNDEDDDPER